MKNVGLIIAKSLLGLCSGILLYLFSYGPVFGYLGTREGWPTPIPPVVEKFYSPTNYYGGKCAAIMDEHLIFWEGFVGRNEKGGND